VIQVQPGRFYSLEDPYLLSNNDWKSDVRQSPNVTYPDLFYYLMNLMNSPVKALSLSAYEYVEAASTTVNCGSDSSQDSANGNSDSELSQQQDDASDVF